MYYYIYKITILKGSLKNHYYIGKRGPIKCLPEEDINYNGSGKKICNWFNSKERISGVDYIKEIIHLCKGKTDLNKMETFYIGDKYNTDPLCLNLMAGGNGGELSEESIERLKIHQKETLSKKTPEEKAESIRKQKETKSKRTPEQKAESKRRFNKTMSEKTPEELKDIRSRQDKHRKETMSKRTPEQKDESNKKRQETINNKPEEERKKTSKKLSDAVNKRYEDPNERKRTGILTTIGIANMSPEAKQHQSHLITESRIGTRMMYKGTEDLTWVKEQEVPYYMSLGYECGCPYAEVFRDSTRMHKGEDNIFAFKGEEKYYESLGYEYGWVDTNSNHKDTIWMKNELIQKNKRVKVEEVPYYESLGYVEGRIKYNNNISGSFFMTDGICKPVLIIQRKQQEYFSKNWYRCKGRKNREPYVEKVA